MWIERSSPVEAARPLLSEPVRRNWLSPAEMDRVAHIRSEHYALRWLGGCWLVKQLLKETDPDVDPRRWHLETRNGEDRPSPPLLFRDGELTERQVSISHSEQSIVAATSHKESLHLGVDLLLLDRWSDAVGRYWFTDNEREWCTARCNSLAAPLVWSIKEAWYKSAHDQRSFAPRRYDVIDAFSLIDASLEELQKNGRQTFVGTHRLAACRLEKEEIACIVLVDVAREETYATLDKNTVAA